MPTVLMIFGWRIFFYSNEGNEPIHVQAQKAEMECKYWLISETFEIVEEYNFNMKPSDKREIRKIIFEHFDYIIQQWNLYFKK
nr:DUF4160 domain-containing protein [Bacteroidota bacterium]